MPNDDIESLSSERIPRHYGILAGTVVERNDPDGSGRVRVRIPGRTDLSAWAEPAGTLGGGAGARGFYDPPDVGADVYVAFLDGLLDQPVYWAGTWGEDEAAPGEEEDLEPATRTLITGYETARHLLIFDRRGGQERIRIADKEGGAVIMIEGSTITVTAATVNVAGDIVNLAGGGAGVARVGDGIQGSIPIGAVLVSTPTGPAPNPAPIPISGTITSGSTKTSSG